MPQEVEHVVKDRGGLCIVVVPEIEQAEFALARGFDRVDAVHHCDRRREAGARRAVQPSGKLDGSVAG